MPQPDGPNSEKNSPSFISNETSSTAFTSAKCFEILLICINELFIIPYKFIPISFFAFPWPRFLNQNANKTIKVVNTKITAPKASTCGNF